MALNIKDPETDRLARRLAELTGESITVALREAISARIDWVESRNIVLRKADSLEVLTEIAMRGRARPVLDDRPVDELLGYDEDGLPS